MGKLIDLFRDRNKELMEESKELNAELVQAMSHIKGTEFAREMHMDAVKVNTEALFTPTGTSKTLFRAVLLRQVDGLKELIKKCKDNGKGNGKDHHENKEE